jgi:hypothetical protein
MTIVEQRFYQLVAANESVVEDLVVPAGSVLVLSEIGANAEMSCVAVVTWDPEGANQIVLSCSRDTVQSTEMAFEGDGIKKMRIELINRTAEPKYVGAYFIGRFGQ